MFYLNYLWHRFEADIAAFCCLEKNNIVAILLKLSFRKPLVILIYSRWSSVALPESLVLLVCGYVGYGGCTDFSVQRYKIIQGSPEIRLLRLRRKFLIEIM